MIWYWVCKSILVLNCTNIKDQTDFGNSNDCYIDEYIIFGCQNWTVSQGVKVTWTSWINGLYLYTNTTINGGDTITSCVFDWSYVDPTMVNNPVTGMWQGMTIFILNSYL